MTFFGSILLEQKLVTAEQMVEALVKQSEELTSPIRICLDKELALPQALLDTVLLAAEQHVTIPEALHQQKLLDAERLESITLIQKKQRRPVGQILVEEGGIDLKKIATLLSAYQKTQDQLPDADGFAFHFPEVQGENKKQYLRFFSSEMKQQIEKLIHALPYEESAAHQLEESAQQLSAAAGFARMEVSRHLIERATILIENRVRLPWAQEAAQPMINDLLRTLDVMWELQRFIEISGSEREFWQNAKSRENYLQVFQSLERHLTL